MYSGTTLKQLRNLDTWFGAHQKIDRLARRQLAVMTPESWNVTFPVTKEILRFEGLDGPDAIKRKTPAQDEPWHYYNPRDNGDTQLLTIIAAHHRNLVAALRTNNRTRVSFEAAWLAHAVVDGLTPAHHYPYEEELQKLRKGAGIESRTTPKEKILMPGDTMREKLQNNWRMWGDKGLLATHIAFEAGVALLILPMRFSRLGLPAQVEQVSSGRGYLEYFTSQALHIADQKYYEAFYASGWTPGLAKRTRREFIPEVIKTVAYVWYTALEEAQHKEKRQ